ncbi:MAG: hypothetical protein GXP03_06865 [Alphaproteobacteria bacterium]|nr:hypothetical protein [Alphaproteobacteria bacterium]
MKALAVLLMLALPAQAAEKLAVPTGQLILPYEALWEDHPESGEVWLVLRFLAPEIAKAKGKISYDDATPDIDFLCENVGLPLVESTGGGVDQIIVTLLDAPLARGERDKKVTRYMNAYRVDQGVCEWEGL